MYILSLFFVTIIANVPKPCLSSECSVPVYVRSELCVQECVDSPCYTSRTVCQSKHVHSEQIAMEKISNTWNRIDSLWSTKTVPNANWIFASCSIIYKCCSLIFKLLEHVLETLEQTYFPKYFILAVQLINSMRLKVFWLFGDLSFPLRLIKILRKNGQKFTKHQNQRRTSTW